MTPEEAIDILSTLAGYENTVALILDYSVSVQDALHMAIKALEQISHLKGRPCESCEFHTEKGCSKWECVFEGGDSE